MRRCIGVLAGTKVPLAVLPPGPSNLFATQPRDPVRPRLRRSASGCTASAPDRRRPLEQRALRRLRRRGLRRRDDPRRRRPQGADRPAGVPHGAARATCARTASAREIQVDGADWYEGRATCVLLGNLGDIFGGIQVFPDAGRTTGCSSSASSRRRARALGADAGAHRAGDPASSPFVRITRGAGRSRSSSTARSATSSTAAIAAKVKSFKVKVEAGALRVRVPAR